MVFLNGDAIPEPDALDRRMTDNHFLLMFNAHSEPVDFTVPPEEYGVEWLVHLQTDDCTPRRLSGNQPETDSLSTEVQQLGRGEPTRRRRHARSCPAGC